MELLVKYGADINRCLENLKSIAATKGNTEMMAYLGKTTGGSSSSAISKDALAVMTEESFEHDASKVTPELVHQLVKGGADINAHGPHGGTALINVINNNEIKNKLPLAKALIQNGANVNLPDKEDPSRLYLGFYPTSPLKAAILKGNLDMVKFLIESGANINQADGGNSPLKAAKSDKIKEYLILNGAKMMPERNSFFIREAMVNNNINDKINRRLTVFLYCRVAYVYIIVCFNIYLTQKQFL